MLCQSLQIQPTITLFRVFQTLCKQGHWFSFAKRRTPAKVCMDDNRSCMKEWKTGFFYTDQRAIPHSMPWRHADSAITEPKPPPGSYDASKARRLSAFVVKLRDMHEGVLVLSGLSRVWRSLTCDAILRHLNKNGTVGAVTFYLSTLLTLPFYYTPPAPVGATTLDPTPDELTANVPDRKVFAKDENSMKRKASTSGSVPSRSSKHKGSSTTNATSVSARKTLFDESYDGEAGDDESGDAVEEDDDDCVEIPLNTPIRYATKLPFEGNHGEKDIAPSTAKGPSNKDNQVKAVVDDCVDTPSGNASHFQGSAGIDPSLAGPSSAAPGATSDDIKRDFFPSMHGPYYADYLKDAVVDQLPTHAEVVRVKTLSDLQLTKKMSILLCLMMSHGRELLACLNSQVSDLKKEVGTLQEKVEASKDALVRVKEKSNGYKKKVRSLTKALNQFSAEAARVASDLNDAHRAEACKTDQIAQAQSFLGNIHTKIQAFKRSIADKDSKILCLKGDNEALRIDFASFFRGSFQGMVQRFLSNDEFFYFQGELLTLAVNAGQRYPLVATFTYPFLDKIDDYSDHPLYVLTRLEPNRLARPTPAPTPRVVVVSPPSPKGSTVTHASPPKELAFKPVPSSSNADKDEQPSKEQNEEWIDPMIHELDEEMVEADNGKETEKENEDVPSASQDVPAASEDGFAPFGA
ncbi:hypothetical protein Tco_0152970 [Tanacetum coccineum]